MQIHAACRLLRASSLHPEVQQCLDATCARLKRLFPKPYKTFKGFHFRRVNHPSYDAWDREVSLPLFGKDQPLAVVDKEEDAADKRPLHLGFEGTLIHEFGHHVDHYIRAKGDDDIKDEWFEIKKRLISELGYVSAYAGTNNCEWVAEQFLAEVKGVRPHRLVTEINTLLKKI